MEENKTCQSPSYDRTKGVGGSDAFKIYNGDWLTLNRIKRGIEEPEDLTWNVPVQIGKATEKLNLELMKKELSVKYEPNVVLQQHEFMIGEVDGITEDGTPIECKHTYAGRDIHDVAEQYIAQLNHYMMLFNLNVEKENKHTYMNKKIDHIILSVLFGNQEHKCTVVDIDSNLCKELYKREKAFWHYVEEDKDPTGFEIFANNKPTEIILDGMRTVNFEDNVAWQGLATEYIKVDRRCKEIEITNPEFNRKKELNSHLKSLVDVDVRKATGNGVTITRNKKNILTLKINK